MIMGGAAGAMAAAVPETPETPKPWIVPKRNPLLGWTFNLATQKGAWFFLGSFLIPIMILDAVILVLGFGMSAR
jgi:hypothetical protein